MSDPHFDEPDALDTRLTALFDAVARQVPASEALVTAVLTRIEARMQRRRKVLLQAAIGGVLLMLGSALLWTAGWSWLLGGLEMLSGFSLPTRAALGAGELLELLNPTFVAPLLALLLWPVLIEAGTS